MLRRSERLSRNGILRSNWDPDVRNGTGGDLMGCRGLELLSISLVPLVDDTSHQQFDLEFQGHISPQEGLDSSGCLRLSALKSICRTHATLVL